MRVLVCGGRDFADGEAMYHTLADIPNTPHFLNHEATRITIVNGKARGADQLADSVAKGLLYDTDPHPADWSGPCRATCRPGHRRRNAYGDYCPAAGNYRNQDMLDSGIDLVIAFPGGRGTADMVARATDVGIPVVEPPIPVAGAPV